MEIQEKDILLNSIRLNLEIFKIKNRIDEKDFNQDIKNEFKDYLFVVDEEENFQINESLMDYNFSKHDVLKIINDFLINISEVKDFNFLKETLKNKLYENYSKMEFPILSPIISEKDFNEDKIADYIIDDYSIDEIISKIPIDNFNQKENKTDLIMELQEFVKIPIFSYISNDLNDLEISKLLIKIENDIKSHIVSGEIGDVVDFYFDNYKLLKKQDSLNHFLNEYVKSYSFRLISEGYNDEIIINSVNRVRFEISTDKTMDKSKVMLKLKDYLKKEELKIFNISELQRYKVQSHNISQEYNLSIDEINEILNQVHEDILENKVSVPIHNYLIDAFELKVELNQSESRIKLNNVIKSVRIREEFKFDKSDLENVSEEIGELIHKNKIRSHQITEQLIIEKLRKIVYGVY